MKKCKNCGEIVSTDTIYCDNCGKEDFIFGKDIVCPVCGFTNDEQFTHCTNCSNALTAELTPAVVDDIMAPTVDLRAELAYNYGGAVEQTSVKESAQCPNCGTEVQINSIFCYRCGTPVTRLHENKIITRKVCHQCNTPNLLAATHCSYCYTTLNDEHLNEYQLAYEITAIGKSVVKRAILQGVEGKFHMCNNCGAVNAHDADFCLHCGLKLVIEESHRYCVNCGAENDGDAMFCTKCQWSFEGVSPERAQGIWKCPECDHVNDNNDTYCVECGLPHADDK